MRIPPNYDIDRVIEQMEPMPPHVEVFGEAFATEPLLYLLIVATIPFMLGLAGSRQPVLAVALYAQHLLLVCIQQVESLHSAGFLPRGPIPFPLDVFERVLVWSLPFLVAGYFAPMVLRKVSSFRSRDQSAPGDEQ